MSLLRRKFKAYVLIITPLAGFTRRIVEVSKAESDAILSFLYHEIAHNIDFQARFKWNTNDVAFWDNRVSPFAPSHAPRTRLRFAIPR